MSRHSGTVATMDHPEETPMLELTVFRHMPVGLDPRPAIALIAHDHEKVRLVDLAVCYRDILARHRLIATATTGRMLVDMVGLKVECVRSGMAGGDRQVADAVVGRGVAAVIFLIDPFSSRPHEPSLDPVMRACSLHDIPLATNIATAGAVLHAMTVAEQWLRRVTILST